MMFADLIAAILIGISGDVILLSDKPVPAPVYHYGTFNQLFGWHNQGIGEM